MEARDPLGRLEFAVMDAVNRGAVRSRLAARQIPSLQNAPAGDAVMHDALRHCEQRGLLRSERARAGRRYELTAAGRAQLRAERRFRVALAGLLVRSDRGRERD